MDSREFCWRGCDCSRYSSVHNRNASQLHFNGKRGLHHGWHRSREGCHVFRPVSEWRYRPTADQLTVHPDFGPLAMIDGATWNAAAGQSLEIDLGFTFESLVPFGEIDRVGSFIMSASGGGVFDPNVGVTVDDYYCLGALSGTVCSGQSGNLHFDDDAPIWIFVFSPIITVREKFTLNPLTGTLIADGLLAPSHDELQTPEPATLWLSGSAGSLIILIRRWKTRDSGAA